MLWQYPAGTLVAFSQYNASAPPACANGAELELRGTKGTLYLFSEGYEYRRPYVFPQPGA